MSPLGWKENMASLCPSSHEPAVRNQITPPPPSSPPSSLLSSTSSVFTSGSGTRSWPVCRWGWGRPPAPCGPGRSGTSAARSCAPAGPAGGPWRPSGPSWASWAGPEGCLYCWRSPGPPPLSLAERQKKNRWNRAKASNITLRPSLCGRATSIHGGGNKSEQQYQNKADKDE